MKKLPKKILKRFNSIQWDTNSFLENPIQATFSWSKIYVKEGVVMTDFFCSKTDKTPLFSLVGSEKKQLFFVAFGSGKNAVYKKVNAFNYNCEFNKFNFSSDENIFMSTSPIVDKVTIHLQ